MGESLYLNRKYHWNIVFAPVGEKINNNGRTFGVSTISPQVKGNVPSVSGFVTGGTFNEVFTFCKRHCVDFEKYRAAIVFFTQNNGVIDFSREIMSKFPSCAFVGGIAAGDNNHAPILVPDASEVEILWVENECRVESMNFHDRENEVSYCADDEYLTEINEEKADQYLCHFSKSKDIEEVNLAKYTISDKTGRNVHCNLTETGIHMNAPLFTERADMRILHRDSFKRRLDEFLKDQNSIVFGCAGLESLINFPFSVAENSQLGFFYGEVVTLNEKSSFANLMMSKIVLGKGQPKASK